MHNACVKRSNVMTPLVWLYGISETMLLLVGAYAHDNWLGISCFIAAIIFMIFCFFMFVYYSIVDPNRLHSEEYNFHPQDNNQDN